MRITRRSFLAGTAAVSASTHLPPSACASPPAIFVRGSFGSIAFMSPTIRALRAGSMSRRFSSMTFAIVSRKALPSSARFFL